MNPRTLFWVFYVLFLAVLIGVPSGGRNGNHIWMFITIQISNYTINDLVTEKSGLELDDFPSAGVRVKGSSVLSQ